MSKNVNNGVRMNPPIRRRINLLLIPRSRNSNSYGKILSVSNQEHRTNESIAKEIVDRPGSQETWLSTIKQRKLRGETLQITCSLNPLLLKLPSFASLSSVSSVIERVLHSLASFSSIFSCDLACSSTDLFLSSNKVGFSLSIFDRSRC